MNHILALLMKEKLEEVISVGAASSHHARHRSVMILRAAACALALVMAVKRGSEVTGIVIPPTPESQYLNQRGTYIRQEASIT